MNITFKPQSKSDLDFLKDVYKSTRRHEIEIMNGTAEQKQQFIDFQFKAQQAHYTTSFKNADFSIIQYNKTRIGRLYIWETEEQIRLIDIAILPDFTNKGIGTKIITDLIAKAKINRKVLSLHVEQHNMARKLYERLGFKSVEDKGVYLYMEYIPN